MEFKIKKINVRTGGILIALMHVRDADLYDIYSMDRVKIKKGKKNIVVTVDITTSSKLVKPGEIGLFHESFSILGAKGNEKVEVEITKKPSSIHFIKKKLSGGRLNEKEMYSIIKDITEGVLSDIEITYFVSGCYIHELSLKETVALTKAMINNGEILKLKKKVVVDKHCIGGVAGNRTTPIVVSILAAAGITIPKTSSRSITSAAGTADTVEVFCKVSFSIKKMKQIVNKTNGCFVWGGGLNLAPSDDKIIKVEHPVSLDPVGQLIASILAKKRSVSATHVLIDIPVGRDAKIEKMKNALRLKKKFKEVGKAIGLKVKVYITDGSQPIGNGIGPILEAREVINILKNKSKDRYHDMFRRKCLHIAGDLIELTGKTKKGKGYMYAKNILESGKAYTKFKEIVKAQEGKVRDPDNMRLGRFRYHFYAPKDGKVTFISNRTINRLAKIAGAPHDKEAGLYLHVHKNSKVKKGDKLFCLYSDSKQRLEFARKEYKSWGGIEIK